MIKAELFNARERGGDDRRPEPEETKDFTKEDWARVSDLVWHGMNRPAAIAHVRRMNDLRKEKK